MSLTNYEISLWEYRHNSSNSSFSEHKIAIIGGSDIDVKSKVVNPILTQNINGKNEFSFTIYTQYFDNLQGRLRDNPFIGLLQNEAKIKLRNNNDWYEFVITSVELSTDNKQINYKCEDAFARELGKAGYELEFEDELLTNQDTAQNLATTILDGTNWSVDTTNSDIINQYFVEPLVEFQYTGSSVLTMRSLLNYEDVKTLHTNDYFYGFYSQFFGTNTDLKQYIFTNNHGQISSDNEVTLDKFDYPTYYIVSASDPTAANGTLKNFKASRLVENTSISHYDERLEAYVTKYRKSGTDYYVFNTTEYVKPTLVSNWIDVSGFEGRILDSTTAVQTEKTYYPPLTSEDFGTNRKVYYKWSASGSNHKVFYNFNYLKTSLGAFEGGIEGKRYIFGIKPQDASTTLSNHFSANIIDFNSTSASIETFFNSTFLKTADGIHYYTLSVISGKEKSLKDVKNISNLKLQIVLDNSVNDINIEKVEFYPYYIDNSALGFITPETANLDVTIRTLYNVFATNASFTSVEDLKLIETLEESQFNQSYTKVQRTNKYEKVRSITGSKSNRYNLLQTICETFECWMHFNVTHDSNGNILTKKIVFKERQGQILPYGFLNGLNLTNANRTTNSSNLVSKIIVSDNANEFANNGSCSISLAKDNYTKENVLFNFDYYLTRNLLDNSTYLYDFYRIVNGQSGIDYDNCGWLIRLHHVNEQREPLIEKLVEWQDIYEKYDADYTVADNGVTAADDEINKYNKYIVNEFMHDYNYIKNNYQTVKSQLTDNVISYIYAYEEAKANYTKHSNNRAAALSGKTNAQTQITIIQTNLSTIATTKETIYGEIYAKYYPYIKEGTWIDEDYIDNDLYYLDAENILFASAFPEVSYSLNVIDLSPLENYKAYIFKPGDITYVQNTDFFGWEDSITPSKIRIYISSIQNNLDEPANNSITVQNFESDFDSLFQKITATTQTLQYKGGVYDRVSTVVTSNGNVSYESISNALNNNKLALNSIGAQTVEVNEQGITTTDTLKTNYKVRVVGSGVYLSNDGGETYKAAVTGDGINTEYLVAGQIDANNINIIDGTTTSFRWDKDGINAYYWEEAGGVRTYDLSRSVRFDKFGIYGYTSNYNFKPANLDALWNNTNVKFQLTDKGFKLRNDNKTIEISSTNDFSINVSGIERVKIGRIEGTSEADYKYGLRLKNSANNITLETKDDGQLWLRDKIYIGNQNTTAANVLIGRKSDVTHSDNALVLAAGTPTYTWAEKEFRVYEDGYFEASSGKIGENFYIGSQTVADFTNTVKNYYITSYGQDIFTIDGTTITPTYITLYLKVVGYPGATTNIQWYYKSGNTWIAYTGATSDTFNVVYSDNASRFVNDQLKLKVTFNKGGGSFETAYCLTRVNKGGTSGDSAVANTIYYSTNTYVDKLSRPSTDTPITDSSSTHVIGTWYTSEITADLNHPYVYSCTQTYLKDNNGTYISGTLGFSEPLLSDAYASAAVSGRDYVTFLQLTNGGTKQAITTGSDGNLYINATMINTGALTVSDGSNTVFSANVGNGTATIGGFAVDSNSIHIGTLGVANSVYVSTGTSGSADIAGSGSKSGWSFTSGNTFGVTKTGELYSTNGKIGGWELGANALSHTAGSYTVSLQSTSGTTDKAISIYDGSSHPFYVRNDGYLYASNATIGGTINATTLNCSDAVINDLSIESLVVNNKSLGVSGGRLGKLYGNLIDVVYAAGETGGIRITGGQASQAETAFLSGHGVTYTNTSGTSINYAWNSIGIGRFS